MLSPSSDKDRPQVRSDVTSFALFCSARRDSVKKENESIEKEELEKLLLDQWNNISESEKVVWNAAADSIKKSMNSSNSSSKKKKSQSDKTTSVVTKKKKKRNVDELADTESSSEESEDEKGNHNVPIAARKTPRAASLTATQKMKDLQTASLKAKDLMLVERNVDDDGDDRGSKRRLHNLDSSSGEDEDSDDEKKKKRLRNNSNTKSMLSSTKWNIASSSASSPRPGGGSNEPETISSNNNPGTGITAGNSSRFNNKLNKSRLGDVEWQLALWGEERVRAVLKAIDRVYDMSLSEDNFSLFGNDMIQCFYDVATATGEPVRSKTLKYVEHLANRWKYTVMQEGWKEEDRPNPCEVIEVVTGMYCMERVGIRHDLKAEVLAFLSNQEAAYSASEYFGWDPLGKKGISADGGIEVISDAHVSRYRLFSSSLIHAFYADRVGLSLGCEFLEIFKWLPTLRPYKGPTELVWQDYVDQCYLVTHIVFTSNNWGELRLSPKFIESLRCFGCTDDDALIREGMRALLDCQTDQGIWDDTNNEDPYRTYHATMCGAQALLAHRFRGFGPGIPNILPLLVKWAEEDSDEGKKGKLFNGLCSTTKNSISKLHQKIKNQRDMQFKDVRICFNPHDYAFEFGNENLSLDEYGAVRNNIFQPHHFQSHVDERLNTLKQAMRSFVKSSSSSSTVVSVPTPEEEDSLNSASPRDKVPTTPASGLSDDDTLTLSQLSELIPLFLQNPSAVSDTEVASLLKVLQQAENIPVTTNILQSEQFGSLAKQIRQLSKLSTFSSSLTKAAALVVNQWKQKILDLHKKTEVTEINVVNDNENVNPSHDGTSSNVSSIDSSDDLPVVDVTVTENIEVP